MYIVCIAKRIHTNIYIVAKNNRIKFNLIYMLQSFIEKHLAKYKYC